jgi:RNA polymerase sigma-70 factor (ECF subfamily)
LKYSKNQQDAEDVLQDSFLTIFDKISQYKSSGSFEGWMKRITINTALQKYRDKGILHVVKEVETVDEESQEINFNDDQLELDFLLHQIQQLPNRYRLVFNLYVLDHYSHKEIAKLLTISEGTSKSNLSRARVLLKQNIESHLQKTKGA